jgi:hypothetical protein
MMTNRFRTLFAVCAAAGALAWPAARAAEMGDFCWLTDAGTQMRFSLTQSGTGHYTYTGLLDDGEGLSYAIVGQASVLANGSVEGSFSGSLATATTFKTGIWHVTFTPALDATIEGIRQVWVRGTDPALVTSAYRTHTATRTACP